MSMDMELLADIYDVFVNSWSYDNISYKVEAMNTFDWKGYTCTVETGLPLTIRIATDEGEIGVMRHISSDVVVWDKLPTPEQLMKLRLVL